MKKLLIKYLMRQRENAYRQNLQNIKGLLETNKNIMLLDLGCDDGTWTKKISQKINTKKVYGIDIVKNCKRKAERLGIKVKIGDLNERFPYRKENFNVVHANQVIEHINNTDLFVSEIYRILKPKGYAVISTENLSSWHNIFALILGFMPFSLTNTTLKTGALGNPLAPHDKENFWNKSSWQHQRVFTKRGLNHLFTLYQFKVEKIAAAGYYPFGNLFSNIDKTHAAFLTFKIRKM